MMAHRADLKLDQTGQVELKNGWDFFFESSTLLVRRGWRFKLHICLFIGAWKSRIIQIDIDSTIKMIKLPS